MGFDGYIISEHDRRIAAIIQAGVIHEIDYEKARARVKVGDWISAWSPWHTPAAGKVNIWNPPAVGELCLLLSIGGAPELGFILAGFYTTTHGVADKSDHMLAVQMPDGARFIYDWEQSSLTANGIKKVSLESSSEVTIKAKNVNLETDELKVTGSISVGKNVKASGDVTAGSISLKGHHHIAQGSSSPTSPPK